MKARGAADGGGGGDGAGGGAWSAMQVSNVLRRLEA
jgi:hypothetical protein